jgi:hypothetical protein
LASVGCAGAMRSLDNASILYRSEAHQVSRKEALERVFGYTGMGTGKRSEGRTGGTRPLGTASRQRRRARD